MTNREALIHFFGGAIGGTAGTAFTCPLEVVKTRLQSSEGCSTQSNDNWTSNSQKTSSLKCNGSIRHIVGRLPSKYYPNSTNFWSTFAQKSTIFPISVFRPLINANRGIVEPSCFYSKSALRPGVAIYRYFVDIIRTEGFGALYKGLGPNLIGVAPSKAVYFYVYSSSKRFLNDQTPLISNSALVHMLSAGCAGFVSATAVNPIWLVKTRLQLHHGPLSISQCIRRVYRNEGFKGFYRGVTASYVGISETIIQFVLYEHLRTMLIGENGSISESGKRQKVDFLHFMAAGGSAKLVAAIMTYPHGLVTALANNWGRLRCTKSNRNVLFYGDDQPDAQLGDLLDFNAVYQSREIRIYPDCRYMAYKLSPNIDSSTTKSDECSNIMDEWVEKVDEPDYVIDVQNRSFGNCSPISSIDYSVTSVLDLPLPQKPIPRFLHSVRRHSLNEPVEVLRDRQGVIRMECFWPVILDKIDGHRISLFPERMDGGRPKDGMFVRYSAIVSAQHSPRCNYTATRARQITDGEYDRKETPTPISSHISHLPSRKCLLHLRTNDQSVLTGLEHVHGSKRLELSFEHELARTLRQVNWMRSDRHSINRECESLFKPGGIWSGTNSNTSDLETLCTEESQRNDDFEMDKAEDPGFMIFDDEEEERAYEMWINRKNSMLVSLDRQFHNLKLFK